MLRRVDQAGPSAPLGATLASLALGGLGISVYLTAVHYSRLPLACTTTGPIDCGAVTTSSYSIVPGTQWPISMAGLVWFGLTGLGALASIRNPPRWLAGALLGWASIGLVTVLYLLGAELVALHRICEWCTAVHAIVLVSFLLALRNWQLWTLSRAG